MQSNTHLAVGACLGLTLTLAAPTEITLLGLCATSIGAIIPDIDIDGTGKKETKYIIMGIYIYGTKRRRRTGNSGSDRILRSFPDIRNRIVLLV